MARTLVENLADTWDPSQYTDEYRENLMKIIKAKLKGKEPKLDRARRAAAGRGRRPDGAPAPVAAGGGRRREGEKIGRKRRDRRRHPARRSGGGQHKIRRCRPGRTTPRPCGRCWPAPATRRSSPPHSPTSPSTTASAPSPSVRRMPTCASGRASATRRPRSFPRSPPRCARGAAARRGPSSSTARSWRSMRAARPIGFQNLQGRIHLKIERRAAPLDGRAFIVFDLLRDGDEDLRPLPLRERRARLAAAARRRARSAAAHQRAGRPATAARCTSARRRSGWEGLIAKRLDSVYKSGRRSPDWRKLKLVRRQACVDRRLDRAARLAPVLRRAAARRLRRRRDGCSTSATPAPASAMRSSDACGSALHALKTKDVPLLGRPAHQRARRTGSSRRSSPR